MKEGDRPSVRDEAAEWYFRRDGGPLDPAGEAAFQRWLAASPAHRAAFDELDATWAKLARLPRGAAAAAGVRPGRRLAAAAVLFAAAFAAAQVLDVPTRLAADAYTAVGETRVVRLDDGSSVTLNTGSAVAASYDDTMRRVTLLRGEAVFQVATDPRRPFVVAAAGGAARALGTVFAVRLDGDGATVTVVESRVAVSHPAGRPAAAELRAGEAVHYAAAGLGPVHGVDADAETAWRRGKLVFVNRPLGSVVAELGRYHAGRIVISDPGISGHLVSGVFDLGDPLRVLDALEASLNLRSTRLTRYLVLLHR
ncbi:fec operon regulator FecR [bacterium YEK0313]|nr:fec operon regulator FecR [bacterium YEK0313]